LSFTVYKSSAGSGKTFTLVKEYLKLILPEPSKYRHILAITFTNKAANEMKERVLFNLKELAKPSGKRDPEISRDLLPLLIAETGLTETGIITKSAEALKLILHNYSDFAIGTIDSFSHRVIRTFAHDFGLPVNFNVELDSDELLETAVDLMLDKVGDDEELTGLLVKFLESRMDEDRSWNIDSTMMDFARVLLNEIGVRHLEKLKNLKLADFDRIVSEIYRQIDAFETRIQKIAEEGVELIEKNDIPLSAFYQGEKGIGGYFGKLTKKRMESLGSDSYTSKTVNEDRWSGGKTSRDDIRKINGIREKLTELYLQIRQERDLHQKKYVFLKLLTKTIYPLAVLNEIDQTLSAFKKQNNIVHISEFNTRIAEIVLNEPVPFIYERLGEKFNHVLIDEFQDTSQLQWSNLQPLIENSLASGYFNLVVGDGKQAIYRWRNGDVNQFTELPSIPGSDTNPLLKDRERILTANFSSYPLNKNFRSRFEIVDFNNLFFAFLSQEYSSELGKVYDDPVQENDISKTGGYVNVEFIEPEEETETYREAMLNRILERIHELELQEFQWRDIAILCRKNRDGSDIARFLLNNGIKVISSESLLLSQSPEVYFITGLMKILNDPSNTIITAELITYLLLKGFLKGLGLNDFLLKINKDNPAQAFFKILEDQQSNIDFRKLNGMPVFELAEELIRHFSLNSVADPYLQFFLDAVMKYSRKNSTSTSAFLEWWETKKDKLSVIIPEGLNAVRIMSVHKAKGLQFPVVIYPFAQDKKDSSRTFLWIDIADDDLMGLKSAIVKSQKDLLETDYKSQYEEEERKSLIDLVNILYVAMTRAEERLYILTQHVPENISKTPSIPLFFDNFFKSTGEKIDGKREYESGVPVKHEVKLKDEISGNITLSSFISNDWRKKVFIRARAPEVWDINDPQKKNQWGNLVHTVLSEITTINDLGKVMDEVSSSGMIDGKDKERLKSTIHEILCNPATSHLFAEGVAVRKEAEILLKDGNTLRPDRVILDGDYVTLIDYKTGKPDEKHERQLRDYEYRLLEMGYKKIRKFLLYTAPEVRLIEIS
jgi:ATP-dependent exoDNAse (exonuclease V) beta subunit